MADEVRLVRTKYSTLTVFKFLLRSESGNILLFFKIMFPEQENNIFDCIKNFVAIYYETSASRNTFFRKEHFQAEIFRRQVKILKALK